MLDVPPARLRTCATPGTHGPTPSTPNLFSYEPLTSTEYERPTGAPLGHAGALPADGGDRRGVDRAGRRRQRRSVLAATAAGRAVHRRGRGPAVCRAEKG